MQKSKVFTQHFDKLQDTLEDHEGHEIPITYYQWKDPRDTEHKSTFDAFTHIAQHFAYKGVEQITVTVTDQGDERVQMFFEGTDTAIEITVYK